MASVGTIKINIDTKEMVELLDDMDIFRRVEKMENEILGLRKIIEELKKQQSL